MKIKESVIVVLILCLGILMPKVLQAATYYIATSGSNSNSGTQLQPFATFSYAFSMMSGGDTLYIMDGTYNQQIKGMPSGSPGNYTKIYAVNDHQVDIDGQDAYPTTGWEALLDISNRSYVEVKGLKVHNSSSNNHVLQISGSDHINIKVSGFWQPSLDKYHYAVTVGGSSDILLEDVWAFGRGRYTVILSSNATNVTLRRVVTRWDQGTWSGEPIAGFSVYKAYNNVLENTITLDHMDSGNHTAGHHGYYVISWNSSYPESRNNRFYGNIAMNLLESGYTIETHAQSDQDNHYFENCVAVETYRGMNILKSNVATIDKCTFINSSGGSTWSSGSFNGGGSAGAILKNSLSYNNSGYGVHNNYGSLSMSYVGSYNNNSGSFSGVSCGSGCRTDNHELLYPTRIEDSSSYKNAGDGGADIGANIVYRYQNGVLTGQALWPWPYEEWIKEDMCDSALLSEVGRTGSNTPKWCTTNKTLTEYVWEYLGNTCPEDICNYNSTTPSPPQNLRVVSVQ